MSDIIKLPLKSLRAKVNLTQQQVASQVGVDRLTYGKWETIRRFLMHYS
ncbi:helix-turn-helix domain-containing protein [Hungatella hathewayi]|nr:helix-turn-helix domain-containing protein [Hungatella hathewayi]